jgi:adenylate cyclase
MRGNLVFVLMLAIACSAPAATRNKTQEKLSKADFAYQKGDVTKAEKLLHEAIEEEPSSVEAHRMLADLLSSSNRNLAAAAQYTTLLQLDDQQHKLSEVERRRAIDQQGVSFALSGDLQRAKSIYLAALEKDPDYAMYNYNLACVYAELRDLDSAIPYLKKSWEKRDTLPSSMKYPDPRKDNSFQPYLSDPKFQEAVRDIVQ